MVGLLEKKKLLIVIVKKYDDVFVNFAFDAPAEEPDEVHHISHIRWRIELRGGHNPEVSLLADVRAVKLQACFLDGLGVDLQQAFEFALD
jgi:hypothetical protein